VDYQDTRQGLSGNLDNDGQAAPVGYKHGLTKNLDARSREVPFEEIDPPELPEMSPRQDYGCV